MVENEVLVNRKSIFGKNKYIITITEEEVDNNQKHLEGKYNKIQKYVGKMMNTHKNIITGICKPH